MVHATKRITPEELANEERFEQVAKIHYKEVIDFVMPIIFKSSPSMWFFLVYLGAVVGYFVFVAVTGFISGTVDWKVLIGQVFMAMCASLVPGVVIHEVLHALGYWSIGARKIQFGANWKQAYFYITAPYFVANSREIAYIAMIPFLLISGACVAGMLAWPAWGCFWGFLLVLHTTMCVGDFAIVSYLGSRSSGQMWSYDDPVSQVSYFYKEKA